MGRSVVMSGWSAARRACVGRPNLPRARHQRPGTRRGFTLVELLVVVFILVILTALAVTAVNFTLGHERIRSAARQIQSYLEGARDRAIYANQPRGVRFLPDQINPNTVSSLVFIGAPLMHTDGQIQLERFDNEEDALGNNNGILDGSEDGSVPGPNATPDGILNGNGIADGPDIRVVRGFNTGWFNLKQRGLLVDGARMRIPGDKNGAWYTVLTTRLTATDEALVLTTPLRDPGTSLTTQEVMAFPNGGPTTYELELPPTPLPGEDPVLLPRGIVIDLDRSKLPPGWRLAMGKYSARMDLMFSPRGFVIGPAASSGLIHFYVCDASVVDYLGLGAPSVPSGLVGKIPADRQALEAVFGAAAIPAPILDRIDTRLIASVFTRTGAISTHPVDATDSNADGVLDDPDDPFRYAIRGEVAGE